MTLPCWTHDLKGSCSAARDASRFCKLSAVWRRDYATLRIYCSSRIFFAWVEWRSRRRESGKWISSPNLTCSCWRSTAHHEIRASIQSYRLPSCLQETRFANDTHRMGWATLPCPEYVAKVQMGFRAASHSCAISGFLQQFVMSSLGYMKGVRWIRSLEQHERLRRLANGEADWLLKEFVIARFPITVGGSTWHAQKLRQVRMREARIRSLVRVASSVGPKEAS